MTPTSPQTTPAPEADAKPARAGVSRRAAVLIALGVVAILALGWVVDGLGTLAPTTRFANGQSQQAGLYRVSLALDPSPPRAGAKTRLAVHVTDATGAAVSTAQVQLEVAMPAMDMAPVMLPTTPGGKGDYQATTSFPMSGAWDVTARLIRQGASSVQTTFSIAVR